MARCYDAQQALATKPCPNPPHSVTRGIHFLTQPAKRRPRRVRNITGRHDISRQPDLGRQVTLADFARLQFIVMSGAFSSHVLHHQLEQPPATKTSVQRDIVRAVPANVGPGIRNLLGHELATGPKPCRERLSEPGKISQREMIRLIVVSAFQPLVLPADRIMDHRDKLTRDGPVRRLPMPSYPLHQHPQDRVRKQHARHRITIRPLPTGRCRVRVVRMQHPNSIVPCV